MSRDASTTGIVSRLLGFFRSTDELDEAAAKQLERRRADDIERACRDPFRFASEEDWQRYRRKHGRKGR